MKLQGADMEGLSQHELERTGIFMTEMLGLTGAIARGGFACAVRPSWSLLLRDLLHERGSCPCQSGRTCFVTLTAKEQDQMFPRGHSLSLLAFEHLYTAICRQAVDETHAT